MVTNYPQRLTAAATSASDGGGSAGSSVVTRIVATVRQAMCGLRGHDSVLHFEHRRVLLRCTTCGHDSPGWEINGQPPRQVFDGDAERHLLRPQLQLRRTA